MPYKVGAMGSYGCSGYPAVKDDGTVMGCHKTRAEAAGQIYAINRSEGNIGKAATDIMEGDYVMGNTMDGEVHGRVEHIMIEGGTLGTPGSQYALESMPPDNPAMSVRIYEEEEDGFNTSFSLPFVIPGGSQSEIFLFKSLPATDHSEILFEFMSMPPTKVFNSSSKSSLEGTRKPSGARPLGSIMAYQL